MSNNLPFIWRRYYRNEPTPSEKVLLDVAHERARQYLSLHRPLSCFTRTEALRIAVNIAKLPDLLRSDVRFTPKSGHRLNASRCPLLGVKQTLRGRASMSAFDRCC